MNWKKEYKYLILFVVVFFVFYYLPVDSIKFQNAIFESLKLTKWYVREHILLCLIPALFIAGGISAFVSQQSVIKYFGAKANKVLSYMVASVSGTILAVCSCTVLPLFAGIYRMGAGIGPAIAFLYSGPAINILAIVLTAKVLGFKLGFARAVFAVIFSIAIGLIMSFIFRDEEKQKIEAQNLEPEVEVKRPLWQNIIYFGSMVGILVFANWSKADESSIIYKFKWMLTFISFIIFILSLKLFFKANTKKLIIALLFPLISVILFPSFHVFSFSLGVISISWLLNNDNQELKDWFYYTWDLSKQIFPLLIIGIMISGFLLGRPGHEAIIPSSWVKWAVGGNSFFANFFSSVVGAVMYFATLTEIPILQALLGSGMGKGPALALLLSGPALSLPNMLVLRQIMGTKKTVIYVIMVVIMSTFTGILYGRFF